MNLLTRYRIIQDCLTLKAENTCFVGAAALRVDVLESSPCIKNVFHKPHTDRTTYFKILLDNGDAFIVEGFLFRSHVNYPCGGSQAYQMIISFDIQITELIDSAPYIKEALEESIRQYNKEGVNFSHGDYRRTA